MRIYEFKCSKCGESFDVSLPTGTQVDTTIPCEVCGGPTTYVFAAPYFHVQGSTTPRPPAQVRKNYQEKEREEGIAEFEKEESDRRAGMREREKLDEQAKRNYCRGELHHKHGLPTEDRKALGL
jgi:putative FmdB family regulatory protein